MTETRPYTSVWSDLANTEFSQGFIDAGGYRTRYLHAGDTSKPTLICCMASPATPRPTCGT